MAWSVGETAYGYAGGIFGRDSYGDKLCIHVGFYAGITYAVFCEEGDGMAIEVISGEQLDQLEEYKQPERLSLDDMQNRVRWAQELKDRP